MKENDSQDDASSNDDEKEISEDEDDKSDDDGLKDNMTLNQYQVEARHETLIRKGVPHSCPSLKKGKTEHWNPCS